MGLSDRATKTRLTKEPVSGMKLSTEGGIYHINRCELCGRLLTKLEIVERLDSAHSGGEWAGLCPCGASRFRPSNPKWWEYFLPRVIRLAFAVWRGNVEPGESR